MSLHLEPRSPDQPDKNQASEDLRNDLDEFLPHPLPRVGPPSLHELVRAMHGVDLYDSSEALCELAEKSHHQAVSAAVMDLEDLWAASDRLSGLRIELERKDIRIPGAPAKTYWMVGLTPSDPAARSSAPSIEEIPPDEAFAAAISETGLRGRHADHGIGAYEFWGARGSHRDMRYELDDTSGDVSIEWTSEELPMLPETSFATHYDFVVTSSRYSARHDETFEDGYEVEVELKGSLEHVIIRPIELDGKALWEISARFSWETV